ncbi:MAG: hypothetical protein AAFP23_11220 [Pseudomonadota bacterium]
MSEAGALSALTIDVDLEPARAAADRTRERLLTLVERHDVRRFGYCQVVSIAPLTLPYSHPVIRLNTMARTDLGLLCQYLHEQMHWYVTWFGQAEPAAWCALLETLAARYPDLHVGLPEGAADHASSQLHLVVNLLEFEAVSTCVDPAAVEAHLRALPFYTDLYARVLDDQAALRALYTKAGLLPLRSSESFSAADIALAAGGSALPSQA